MSKSHIGKKHSQESILKMRLAALGENNSQWKGENIVDVDALHLWLRRRLIPTKLCAICHERPPHDLANKTGIYNRDFENWYWLCRRCHVKSDGRINNLKQFQVNKNSDTM